MAWTQAPRRTRLVAWLSPVARAPHPTASFLWTRSLWTTLGPGRPFGLYISEDIYGPVGAHPGTDATGVAPGGVGEEGEEIALMGEPVPWLDDTPSGAEPDAVAAPLAVLLVDDYIPPGH